MKYKWSLGFSSITKVLALDEAENGNGVDTLNSSSRSNRMCVQIKLPGFKSVKDIEISNTTSCADGAGWDCVHRPE